MSIQHVKSVTVADGTNTDLVRPTDWNSFHNQYLTLAGNTAGASALSGQNIVFAGGNNVTLSANGQTVSIHAAAGGGGGGNVIAAGGSTANSTDTVVFSNSNGIVFGLNGNTLTASHNGYTGATTQFLTTAALSNHSHGAVSLALTNLNGTANSASNGLTLSLSVNPGGAGDGGNVLAVAGSTANSTGTIVFSNSNGIVFGLNGNTVTASHNGYTGATTQWLTTAALSNHVHSLNDINAPVADVLWFMNTRQIQLQWGTNATGFTTAAGRQGLFEIDFAANNFTDVAANLDVVHIHASTGNPPVDLLHLEAAGTGATALRINVAGSIGGELNAPLKFIGGSVPLVLGTSQSNLVANLNANYLNGSQASQFQASGNYLTTAAQSNHTHGAGPSITGAIAVTSQSNAWSLSIGPYITTARASNDAVGLNTALTANGVAWTVNSSGLSLNIPAFLTTAMASNAGSGFMSTSERANYFATNANTFANSTHTHGGLTLNLTNVSASSTSASNGLTLNLSVASPGGGGAINVVAGTTNGNLQTLQFDNANGVSFGLNGSTVTASVNAAGGGVTDSVYPWQPQALYSSSCNSGTSGNTGGSIQWTVSGYLAPIVLERPLHFSDVEMYVSYATVAGTGSMSFGHALGFYSLNGGTAHSLISSFCWQASMSQNSVSAQTWHQYRDTASSTFSTAANGNISASYTGQRQLVMHTTSQSLAAGTYYIAHIFTAKSGGSLIGNPASAFYLMPAAGSASTWWTGGARMGANTTAAPMYEKGLGIFSTTTNQSTLMMPVMPASINTTAITNTGGSSQWRFHVPLLYL